MEHYGSKPVKVFKLTPNDSLAICGTMEQKNGMETYTEFIVYTCGSLYAIGSWDGTQTCTITQSHDTLMVEELYGIANGPGMTIQWIPFYETRYYSTKNSGQSTVASVQYFRQDQKKYTEAETKQALAGYKAIHLPVKNYDAYLLSIHRLFWAYVSGSREAGVQLDMLRKKYGTYDGAVGEEFDGILATYEHYKKVCVY